VRLKQLLAGPNRPCRVSITEKGIRYKVGILTATLTISDI